jgi:Tol biopolymer transport system component
MSAAAAMPARHLQRQLQHQPAHFLGRQDAGLDLAARRQLPAYVLDLASGQEQRLADTTTEPSFSPNGKYIMYATKGRRKSLAVVSVDGRVKQRLTTQAGNIKEPTWGPFMK